MSDKFKFPMKSPFRLPLTDILHRGLVWSLFGVSVWGLVMMGTVHRDKMRRGEGALAQHQAAERQQIAQEDEVRERELAEAAQKAVATGRFRS